MGPPRSTALATDQQWGRRCQTDAAGERASMDAQRAVGGGAPAARRRQQSLGGGATTWRNLHESRTRAGRGVASLDRMKRRLLLGAAIESVLTTSCGTDVFDVYLVNPARSPCEWTFITARSSRTVIRIRCMPRSAEGRRRRYERSAKRTSGTRCSRSSVRAGRDALWLTGASPTTRLSTEG